MGLAYLKVEAEESIQQIDDCIVAGYKLKDSIVAEYKANKERAEELLPKWRELAGLWTQTTIQNLAEIFISEKELYNFRDAPTSALSRIGWNIELDNIVKTLDARITKLNEYDDNIRNHFRINLEIVMRDKIVQSGNGNNNVKTKN